MHGAQGFNVLASSADHSGRVSDALSLVLCLIISFNNVGIISDINFRMKLIAELCFMIGKSYVNAILRSWEKYIICVRQKIIRLYFEIQRNLLAG